MAYSMCHDEVKAVVFHIFSRVQVILNAMLPYLEIKKKQEYAKNEN